jgi:hypothetical protein
LPFNGGDGGGFVIVGDVDHRSHSFKWFMTRVPWHVERAHGSFGGRCHLLRAAAVLQYEL